MYLTSCDLAACFCSFPGFETAKAFGFFPAFKYCQLRRPADRYDKRVRGLKITALILRLLPLVFGFPMRPIRLVLHGEIELVYL